MNDENGTDEVMDGATDVTESGCISTSVEWFVGRFCIIVPKSPYVKITEMDFCQVALYFSAFPFYRSIERIAN